MPYRGGGYMRKGVLYEGPTRMPGRPKKAPAPVIVNKSNKKTVAKAVNKKNVSNISKIVKKVLSKDEEVKVVSNLDIANDVMVYGGGLSFAVGGTNNGWVSVNGLLPTLTQGTSQATRIGNKINPKRFNVRYSIYSLPSTDSTTGAGLGGNINPFVNLPFMVKVIVFRHRYAIDDFSQTGILQSGATSTDLTNSVDTFFRPYNRDEYIIAYSKLHKLQPQRHAMATSYTGQLVDPSIRSMVIRSMNIRLPKLRYNDGSNTASNAQWYIAFAVCNEDGTTIAAGNQTRCKVNVESHLYFTDA